ncbi:hypothetical protein PCANB_002574 [Pneumocystis canis]|nr:hypothetical protein PCK1_002757 [Pneumocystis canis]KAG5438471.1 hypothetical protein PCANB_002574 [Pneumocystis canis]
MLILGVTGSIATGKSTVSKILQEKYSWPLIDVDKIAKQTMIRGTVGYNKVKEYFGKEIIENDEIDRNKLAEIIFFNANERKMLNKIIHPEIFKVMFFQIFKAWIRGENVLIIDVPLLFETGFYYFCEKIICVACQENIQIERLQFRNNYMKEDAEKRIKSQMPLSYKVQLADIVIWNNGTKEDLEIQVVASTKNIQPRKIRNLFERIFPVFTIMSIIYIMIKRWLLKKKI